MATITEIKKLRTETGFGVQDCKEALDNAAGDFDKAVEALTSAAAVKMAKHTEARSTSAGLVAAGDGSLIELKCETDFVAKGDIMKNAAQAIADAVANAKAWVAEDVNVEGKSMAEFIEGLSIRVGEKVELGQSRYYDGDVVVYLHKTATDLPPTGGAIVEYVGDVEAARHAAKQIFALDATVVSRMHLSPMEASSMLESFKAEAVAEGKPEQLAGKIAEGKLNKYFSTVSLVDQPWIQDDSRKFGEVLSEHSTSVRRFARLAV